MDFLAMIDKYEKTGEKIKNTLVETAEGKYIESANIENYKDLKKLVELLTNNRDELIEIVNLSSKLDIPMEQVFDNLYKIDSKLKKPEEFEIVNTAKEYEENKNEEEFTYDDLSEANIFNEESLLNHIEDVEITPAEELLTGVNEEVLRNDFEIPEADYKETIEESKNEDFINNIPEAKEDLTIINDEFTGNLKEFKKIVNRREFNWKGYIHKKLEAVKAAYAVETTLNHSENFKNIDLEIANFRLNYPNKELSELNGWITRIDNSISNDVDLTIPEKRKLYRKLAKLANRIDRLNNKSQIERVL